MGEFLLRTAVTLAKLIAALTHSLFDLVCPDAASVQIAVLVLLPVTVDIGDEA